MMLGMIVIASLSGGAHAQATATGLPTCQCLGALPGSIARYDCTYDFSPDGKCVMPIGLTSNFTHYPSDFGGTCKIHKDPGMAACYDLTVYPPVEKQPSDQANWCLNKWCYVDPCACDASDATKSDFFPGILVYSYATCGDKNTYTAMESATNTVGNSECSTEEEKASDAHSLKMGISLLLAGVGLHL